MENSLEESPGPSPEERRKGWKAGMRRKAAMGVQDSEFFISSASHFAKHCGVTAQVAALSLWSSHILVGGNKEPTVRTPAVVLAQQQLHFGVCSYRIITDIYFLVHKAGLTGWCLGLAVLGF